MMDKQYGDFKLSVGTGGHPIWIGIRMRGNEIRFSHFDLADLEHLVKMAKKEALNQLSDKDKKEV